MAKIQAPLLLTSCFIASARARDWNSPTELVTELKVYQGIIFALVGLQLWEHIISLPFELRVYSGRTRWRHGMLAYLLIRYATWASLIPLMININTTSPSVDCEASLIALLVPFSLVVVTTSLVFVIRCIAVWEKNRVVTSVLVGLWLVESALHFSSAARIRSHWNGNLCATWFTRPLWEYNLANLFVLATDLVTFVLMTYKLRKMLKIGGIGRALFQQSILYVGVATGLNVGSLVLFYLNLSPLLGYIGSPIAMLISGIVGCRAFRDLQRSARRTASTQHHTAEAKETYSNHWNYSLSSRGGPEPSSCPLSDSNQAYPFRPSQSRATPSSAKWKEDWLVRFGLQESETVTSDCGLPSSHLHQTMSLPSRPAPLCKVQEQDEISQTNRLQTPGHNNTDTTLPLSLAMHCVTVESHTSHGSKGEDRKANKTETLPARSAGSSLPKWLRPRAWLLMLNDLEAGGASQTDTTRADHGHSNPLIAQQRGKRPEDTNLTATVPAIGGAQADVDARVTSGGENPGTEQEDPPSIVHK